MAVLRSLWFHRFRDNLDPMSLLKITSFMAPRMIPLEIPCIQSARNVLPLSGIHSYQTALQGHADSLSSAAGFQLFQNVCYMDFDRAFSDI